MNCNELIPLFDSALKFEGTYKGNRCYVCPFCGKDNGHFSINFDKGVYNCWVCGNHGSVPTLIMKLGLHANFDYSILTDRGDNLLENVKKLNEPPKVDKINYHKIKEFFDSNTKDIGLMARYYLYQRGINNYYIEMYNIREGINNYANRVIIPNYNENGKLSYFVTRDYTGLSTVKYLNPPSELCKSSDNIWNINNLIKRDDIILCEGVFTAIAVNVYLQKNIAGALYGKTFKEYQGEYLSSMRLKRIFLCLDVDAGREIMSWANYLSNRNVDVRLILIPPKYGKHADASDIGKDAFLECMKNSMKFDLSSKLKLLKYLEGSY